MLRHGCYFDDHERSRKHQAKYRYKSKTLLDITNSGGKIPKVSMNLKWNINPLYSSNVTKWKKEQFFYTNVYTLWSLGHSLLHVYYTFVCKIIVPHENHIICTMFYKMKQTKSHNIYNAIQKNVFSLFRGLDTKVRLRCDY